MRACDNLAHEQQGSGQLKYAEPVPVLGPDGIPLWKRIKKLGIIDQGTACCRSTTSSICSLPRRPL
jgi:hypothetical protein